MKDFLIIMIYPAFMLCILIWGFMGMQKQERYKHELKIACITAGKTLIDGNCIDGN